MEELYRNLAIAMACVFVTTFLLIANLFACCLVLLCVILTLVKLKQLFPPKSSCNLIECFLVNRFASTELCIFGVLQSTQYPASISY